MGFLSLRKKYLDIRTYGDPLLARKAKAVGSVTPEIADLALKMIETMIADDGVGLAAPQVGKSIRMIVLGQGAVERGDAEAPAFRSPGEILLAGRAPLVLLNPVLTGAVKAVSIREEGCLSVPGIYAEVERPSTIHLNARILGREEIDVDCGGFLARVIQHEVDHLDGILFIDRLKSGEYEKIKLQLDELFADGQKRNFLKKVKSKGKVL